MANTAVSDNYFNSAKPPQAQFLQKVLRLIDNNQGIPAAPELARQLNIAQSTLQRRLKREGTSYQRIKNNYRFNLAKYYLRHSNNNAAEIAYLIGFKETDAFFKAFKRWTQKTPGEFRKHYLESSGG